MWYIRTIQTNSNNSNTKDAGFAWGVRNSTFNLTIPVPETFFNELNIDRRQARVEKIH